MLLVSEIFNHFSWPNQFFLNLVAHLLSCFLKDSNTSTLSPLLLDRMLKFEFVICSEDGVLWDQPFLNDDDDDDADDNALGHEWNGPQAVPVETMTW